MKKMLKSISILLGIGLLAQFIIASCSVDTMNQTFKENAGGAVGEIILVTDEGIWESALGEELKEIFGASFPGLYRNEAMFSVRYVKPERLTKTLRNARNVIYVNVLNDNSAGSKLIRGNYSEETLDRIANDPELFMQIKQDEFAVGQETMHLFGRNKEELIAHLQENRDKLRDYFNKSERRYLTSKLVKNKQSDAIREAMVTNFGKALRVPFSYRLVEIKDDFIWFRNFDGEVDRNIYMHVRPYTSESVFENQNLIELRDEIGLLHLYGDPANAESFVMTEQRIPIEIRQVNFVGNRYAKEVRGQWRTNNKSMGGSFISYVFLDEANKNLVFLEGFIYYPNEKHRDVLREIEATLWTYLERSEPRA
jgi:hypothetical protein